MVPVHMVILPFLLLQKSWTVAGIQIYATQMVVIIGAVVMMVDPLWVCAMDQDWKSHACCI